MGEGNKMGLGLMDGFPPAFEFWEHWCRSEGDIIGTVGSSGRSTGPHLDIRLNWFNVKLDPATVLEMN